MLHLVEKLTALLPRLTFAEDGSITITAPSGGFITIATPLKAFRSTGIADEATTQQVKLTDGALVLGVSPAIPLGLFADRPETSSGEGNCLLYFATDKGTNGALVAFNGTAWINTQSGAIET